MTKRMIQHLGQRYFRVASDSKIEEDSPRGPVRLFRFLINKCRHDINKLNFSRNTKFSNLSSEKKMALQNLSKRRDIIVKAADKGGSLVVWQTDLYQKEACGNFLTPLFTLKSIKISLPITNKLSRALLTIIKFFAISISWVKRNLFKK